MAHRRQALRLHGHSSDSYKSLNRAVRSSIRRDIKSYLNHKLQNSRHQFGLAFYSYGRWRKEGNARDVPSVSADDFNTYFVGVRPRVAAEVTALAGSELPCRLSRVGACSFSLSPVSLGELLKVIFGMRSSSAGHDELRTPVFKASFDAISDVFLHIVNSSLQSAKVPDAWKHSIVIPILKTGRLPDPSSFGPISIIPTFAKIVEKVVQIQIHRYFSSNHLPTDTPHGFRPGHPTETALIDVTDRILSTTDSGRSSLPCLLDLQVL